MDEIELSIELSGVYDELVDIIGEDKVIEIAKLLGGSRVYFPKFQSIIKPQRDGDIVSEFNGYNIRDLAKKHDLSDNRIRQICKEKIEERRNKPVDNQISMFDMK